MFATYILIIMTFGANGGGVAIHETTFQFEDQCRDAEAALEAENTQTRGTIIATCVKKS